MFASKLTPQQRLQKAVIAIMGNERYRALAPILMIGERKIKEGIPTACTNGRDEYYGAPMIEAIHDANVRYIVLHESYHKMFRHLITWKNLWDIDPQCANQACDYYINLKLNDENQDGFAVMPEGQYKGLVDERFRGMNAAEIFKILRKEKQEGGGSGSGSGEGFDEHDWEGAQELTPDEKHQLERDIDEAIRQGALAAGKTGTGVDMDMQKLLEPKVNWREVLRDFVVSTCAGNDYSTWRMPSRRYIAGGLYMPRGVSESVNEICVESDMSGSTYGIVPQFMSEFVAICKTVKPQLVRHLYWDTVVEREEKYEFDQLDAAETVMKPKGGGGTTVQCVPDYCNEFGIKPQAHIVLTDGCLGGNWGKGWNAPVLWVIVNNPDARPSHGKYVHIDAKEIYR